VNYFIFIDESGVLQSDRNQPLFGIGLLKIADTSRLYIDLVNLKDRLYKALPDLRRPFEFKFSEVNNSTYPFYLALLGTYFSYPEASYSVMVLDKFAPAKENEAGQRFSSVWDAYIACSSKLIHESLNADDLCCVIADFITRPKNAGSYYEEAIRKINGERIFNAMMLESDASLFIQLVDVITGCVLYDYRCAKYPRMPRKRVKKGLVEALKGRLNIKSMACSFAIDRPSCFSVREMERISDLSLEPDR